VLATSIQIISILGIPQVIQPQRALVSRPRLLAQPRKSEAKNSSAKRSSFLVEEQTRESAHWQEAKYMIEVMH
jgi:hypothetical protein